MQTISRREAIAISLAGLAGGRISLRSSGANARPAAGHEDAIPWYRKTLRWGQTWLIDSVPTSYDIAWWRDYWKRTAIQGVVINAGGDTAFYPSKFPLHQRARSLNGRDLFGELTRIAHEDGLSVLARMDSSVAGEDFYRAHPDWFSRKLSGEPYRFGDSYATCINSPYYDEYMPKLLREVIERSQPEGIAESAWSRMTRETICYCTNCSRKFRDTTGKDLPKTKDWTDPTYRTWIEWNYVRRTELWDFNNRVAKDAGGPHCLWVAMLYLGGVLNQNRRFYDVREIGRRSEFMLWDNDARAADEGGFEASGDTGCLAHQLMGWDKVAVEYAWPAQILEHPVDNISETDIEDMAAKDPVALERALPMLESYFDLAAKPEPEARMWMIDGISGGLGPAWCFVGTSHYDRRMYRNPERVFQWHRHHQEYLTNRTPVAVVGVVWSQRNGDYYGRDEARERVDEPYRGFTRALLRARIPYLPIHVSDIEEQAKNLSVLVFPNVGLLSDLDCMSIRRFAERGGAVVASGATSLYDEWGELRPALALADLFGASTTTVDFGRKPMRWLGTYLRFKPEIRRRIDGPASPADPASGDGDLVFRGFESTDIIPFGGELEGVRVDPKATVVLTYDPLGTDDPGDVTSKTEIPALVLNTSGPGRVAYLPADLDRRYALNKLPDLGNLLANIVRWAAADRMGFELDGPGLLDCRVYRQPGRLILHVVNLSNQGTWQTPLEELIPVGPLKVKISLPQDVRGGSVESLVSNKRAAILVRNGLAYVDIEKIVDHEVLVVS